MTPEQRQMEKQKVSILSFTMGWLADAPNEWSEDAADGDAKGEEWKMRVVWWEATRINI